MAIQTVTDVKGYFNTDDVPTEQQMADMLDTVLDRSRHTGQQTASTISDFQAQVSLNPDVQNASGVSITTSYADAETSSSGTITLTGSGFKSYASATLSENTTIAIASMNVGDTFKLKVADMAGYTLSLPSEVTVLRGDFEDGLINYLNIEMTNTDEYIAEIFSVIDTTAPAIAGETLLFRHDYSGGLVFADQAEAESVNAGSANPAAEAKYSIMNTIETYRRTGGEFRLKVVYPNEGYEYIFEQTSDPINTATNTVTGFSLISTSSGAPGTFTGLCLAPSGPCVFEGKASSSTFWFGLGAKFQFNSGVNDFPGPDGTFVTAVELYSINT